MALKLFNPYLSALRCYGVDPGMRNHGCLLYTQRMIVLVILFLTVLWDLLSQASQYDKISRMNVFQILPDEADLLIQCFAIVWFYLLVRRFTAINKIPIACGNLASELALKQSVLTRLKVTNCLMLLRTAGTEVVYIIYRQIYRIIINEPFQFSGNSTRWLIEPVTKVFIDMPRVMNRLVTYLPYLVGNLLSLFCIGFVAWQVDVCNVFAEQIIKVQQKYMKSFYNEKFQTGDSLLELRELCEKLVHYVGRVEKAFSDCLLLLFGLFAFLGHAFAERSRC